MPSRSKGALGLDGHLKRSIGLVPDRLSLLRPLFGSSLFEPREGSERRWGEMLLKKCCFAHYFDATFLIRLMRSDYFEGSHWGTPLCVFQISSVEANRTCSALTCWDFSAAEAIKAPLAK
jgi:hypothetical protein